jgi:hypothetical protein
LKPCTQVGGGTSGGRWFTQVLLVQLVTQKLLHCVHSRPGSADAVENTDNTSQAAVATIATPHFTQNSRLDRASLFCCWELMSIPPVLIY